MALKVDDINDIKTCLNCTRAKCRGYCEIVNNGGNEANHKPREKSNLKPHQRYYQKNRDKCKERSAKWKQEHPDKVKEYNRRARERQKAAREKEKANEC